MAPTKRELNGGMLHGHNSEARPGRKNSKIPAINTTKLSTAVTNRKKEGTRGLLDDRSNMSGRFFHIDLDLILSSGEETKVNADDRLEAMQPDIMAVKRQESKPGLERGDQAHHC